MNAVDTYILALDEGRKEKLMQVVSYIRERYPEFPESCDYAPKTKFPVFKNPTTTNYVAIASQKAYIALHFGRYQCAQIVVEADARIKTGVGCAQIPDSVPFPLQQIKAAIDKCFGEE